MGRYWLSIPELLVSGLMIVVSTPSTSISTCASIRSKTDLMVLGPPLLKSIPPRVVVLPPLELPLEPPLPELLLLLPVELPWVLFFDPPLDELFPGVVPPVVEFPPWLLPLFPDPLCVPDVPFRPPASAFANCSMLLSAVASPVVGLVGPEPGSSIGPLIL